MYGGIQADKIQINNRGYINYENFIIEIKSYNYKLFLLNQLDILDSW